MKQQVLIIHGGTTFNTKEEFISYLKNKEITLEKLRLRKEWKDSLPEKLGEKFDILLPWMPNITNSHYDEWKIWFEKIIPLLDENVILIGHSLGGIFLAKYLSENSFQRTIKAVILVAAPFDDESEESLTDFRLPFSLDKLDRQCKIIYLIQSKDDLVVPFGELEKYKHLLPNAKTIIFEDKGHFKLETFPEIVELIKSI